MPAHAVFLLRDEMGGWIPLETTYTSYSKYSFEDALEEGKTAMGGNSGAIIVDIHNSLNAGIVPIPSGVHECNIADTSIAAQEYLNSSESSSSQSFP